MHWRLKSPSPFPMLLAACLVIASVGLASFAAAHVAESEPALQMTLEPDAGLLAQAPATDAAPAGQPERWSPGVVGEFAAVIVTGDQLGKLKVQLVHDEVLSRDGCSRVVGARLPIVGEERTAAGRLVNWRAHGECMRLRGPVPKPA